MKRKQLKRRVNQLLTGISGIFLILRAKYCAKVGREGKGRFYPGVACTRAGIYPNKEGLGNISVAQRLEVAKLEFMCLTHHIHFGNLAWVFFSSGAIFLNIIH